MHIEPKPKKVKTVQELREILLGLPDLAPVRSLGPKDARFEIELPVGSYCVTIHHPRKPKHRG